MYRKDPIYIVTGASGHVGNTLVRMLLSQGKTVRGLVVPGDRSAALCGLNLEIIAGDVRHADSLAPLFADPDGRGLIVLHTAGVVSIASKFQQLVYDVNVKGTETVVRLCLAHGVEKLVHVSSVHAIPELPKGNIIREVSAFSPDSVHGLYAQTKAEATQLVLDSVARGLNASVVHPTGILGGGDYGSAHLTQMVMDYLDGRLVACIKGGYDFVDVRDVAEGILACAAHGRAGECYILSNRYFSISGLLGLLHQISGRERVRVVLPLWLAKATAPAAELYYKLLKQPPLYTPYSLYTVSGNAAFSHRKATGELGYHPREMRDTLSDMVLWLKENGRIKPDNPRRTGTG